MSQIAIWRTLPVEPFGYWHHGVLCPDKTVIHFKSRASLSAKRDARIVHSSLTKFKGRRTPSDTPVYKIVHRKQLPPDEVVTRARSRLGQRGYNLLHNNCESFARWCVVGVDRSFQIEALASAFRHGYRAGSVAGAMYAVAKTAADMPRPCPSMVPLKARRVKSKRYRAKRSSRSKGYPRDRSSRDESSRDKSSRLYA